MTYLELAYLAELAVAFNLAFGEFKHEKTSQYLTDSFKKLDGNCEVEIALLLKSFAPESLAQLGENHHTEFIQASNPRLSWRGRCVRFLDQFRKDRLRDERGANKTYNPIREFWRRALLFASPPAKIRRWESRSGLMRVIHKIGLFLVILSGMAAGLLASWAYPKTDNWPYPPCRSSVVVWSVMAFAAVVLLFVTDPSGNVQILLPLMQFTFAVPCFPWSFIAVGGFFALVCPRPLSVVAGKAIGRYPPTPRGRYYPLIFVVLITAVLTMLTILQGSQHLAIDPAIANPTALWFFTFGFLVTAVMHPIAIFAGYLALETALSNWTKEIDNISKEVATGGINRLLGQRG